MSLIQGGLCQDLQQALVNIAGENAPVNAVSEYGVIRALLDPVNTAGFEVVDVNAVGQNRKVQILWYERVGEDAINDTLPQDLCAKCDQFPQREQIVDIEKAVSHCVRVSLDEMRDVCNITHSEKILLAINRAFDALAQKMATALTADLLAKAGTYVGGATSKDFQLLKVGNTAQEISQNYGGEIELLGAFEDMRLLNGAPIIVGGRNLRNYSRLAMAGCCDQFGINYAQSGTLIRPHFDIRRFPSDQYGSESFVGWLPGAAQLLQSLRNVGQYAWDWNQGPTSSSLSGTITDPVRGIAYDLDITFDECKKEHTINISKMFDLWTFPANAFSSDDHLDGVNFVIKGNLTRP